MKTDFIRFIGHLVLLVSVKPVSATFLNKEGLSGSRSCRCKSVPEVSSWAFRPLSQKLRTKKGRENDIRE